MKQVKYFTKSGEEATFGDMIHLHEEKNTKYGSLVRDEVIELTEDSLPYLIKRGAITIRETVSSILDKDNDYILQKLVNKFALFLDCEYEEAIEFLGTVYDINSASFYSMVLKKLAVEFDKEYDDHISKAEDLWFINIMTHEIFKWAFSKTSVNFHRCAAFRTPEAAKKALELANIMTMYFNEQ